MLDSMKTRAWLTMLTLLTIPIVVVHGDNRVLGTNVEMGITALYKRSEFWNTYSAFAGSMKVLYKRENLNNYIAKYKGKPWIYNEKWFVIDEERYEGENKYLMIFHSEGNEHEKCCILFIGDQSETVIFVTWINVSVNQDLYERTIHAYLTSNKTNEAFDFREALYFKIELTDPYILNNSEGSFFEVRKSGKKEAEETVIQFHSWINGNNVQFQLEQLLFAFAKGKDGIIESRDYRGPTNSVQAWRMISQEKGTSSYNIRYLMLLTERRILFVKAMFRNQELQIATDEIERIMSSIRFD